MMTDIKGGKKETDLLSNIVMATYFGGLLFGDDQRTKIL